jgi:signal transduction histidine kinase
VTGAKPRPRRWGLTARLVGSLLLSAAALTALLLGYVAPRTATILGEQGDALRSDNAAALRSIAGTQTRATADVLVDLIDKGAAARRRTLRDLPLESLPDTAAIRAAIETEDAARSDRQRRNVEILAAEMQRRADAAIAERLDALQSQQAASLAEATARLRGANFVLVAAALLLSLALLWFGLHRLVVRPAQALQAATRRIAAGELDADVPPPTGGELGDLARDFADMQTELRRSRAALEAHRTELEIEVKRQTAHLERALADLQASHRQLAAAERLAALGTLAGGIAHEFQNVIGGIRGCTEELRVDEHDAERRETMEVILRAAERGSGIVQQLLRFARRSVETRTDLDLAELCGDALRLCEPGARRQGVTVQRHLATSGLVHGDPIGLHQVVVNLLLNALQAMPDGGTLSVAVELRGDLLAIVVRDTGRGIAPEHLAHIFEPFFTTRGAESQKPGTGLGLSVSHGIVEAHGGRIEVASTPGSGTTFTVLLPRRDAALPPGNAV